VLFNVQATGYAKCKPALFGACPKPGQIRRVAAERAFCVKMGDDGGGGTDSLHGVVSRLIVGVSAFVFFPGTIKSKRWRAVMEEIDKGCGKFCITVGTATRTAVILIHSQLKVLTEQASRLTDFGSMLA